jgi:hypothetical protein
MMLLAAASLGVLGVHLWPWQEITNLPGNGTVAFDPALCLLAYVASAWWITSGITEPTQKALSAGAMAGLLAGVVLVADVLLGIRQDSQPAFLQPTLLGVAAILWGVAGLRGSRIAGSSAMGALSGLWAAMVSSLMAGAAVVVELYIAAPVHNSTDPWRQYESLAIGNTMTQGLVHSLNMATAFLLLGPITGAAAGLIFAFFAHEQKN